MNSPYKGQWLGALMLSFIYAWTSGWVNNRDPSTLICHRFLRFVVNDQMTPWSRAWTLMTLTYVYQNNHHNQYLRIKRQNIYKRLVYSPQTNPPCPLPHPHRPTPVVRSVNKSRDTKNWTRNGPRSVPILPRVYIAKLWNRFCVSSFD